MVELTPINEIEKQVAVDFNKQEKALTVEQPTNKGVANELIDYSLGEAVRHKIKSDDEVKGRLLKTADKVIDTAMNVAENTADTEDKKAYFANKKGACECWGYDEETTDKNFVKLMATIHSFFTAVWIIIGAVTFAPIIFVAKKLQVIVKKTWVAVLIAVFIYLAIILTPTLLSVLGK